MDTISDALYQHHLKDSAVISRSPGLSFNVETQIAERKTGWEGELEMEKGGGMSRERGGNEEHKDPDGEFEGDKENR